MAMPHNLLKQGVTWHTSKNSQKKAIAVRVGCWPMDFAPAPIMARTFIFIVAVWIYSRNRQLCRRYVLETLHHNMLGLPIKKTDEAKFL